MPDIQDKDSYDFANHLRKFVGETVTVFTLSGGESGNGFTGVLLEVTNYYLRLLIKPSPRPCITSNANHRTSSRSGFGKRSRRHNHQETRLEEQSESYICTAGAVADIPLCSIASFIHNAL